jgi:hypothetical protein
MCCSSERERQLKEGEVRDFQSLCRDRIKRTWGTGDRHLRMRNDCLEMLLVCEPYLKAARRGGVPWTAVPPGATPRVLFEARHKSRARMAWADLYSIGARRRSMARPSSVLPLWTVATAKPDP